MTNIKVNLSLSFHSLYLMLESCLQVIFATHFHSSNPSYIRSLFYPFILRNQKIPQEKYKSMKSLKVYTDLLVKSNFFQIT